MRKRLLSLALATLVLVLPVLTTAFAENDNLSASVRPANAALRLRDDIWYEDEPNDTFSQANEIYSDADNYGYISSSYDVDLYWIEFEDTGLTNFWLGNIPEGCDYDLTVYDGDGYTVIASSSNSGNQNELIRNHLVHEGDVYFIEVCSYSGYSEDDHYWLRVKNYPCSHSYYAPEYEAAHPHRAYEECSNCGYVHYLNYYAVYPHGDGTNSTCPDCGEHGNFTRSSIYIVEENDHDEPDSHWEDLCTCTCGITVYNLTWHLFNSNNNIRIWFEDTDYQSYFITAISTWHSFMSNIFLTNGNYFFRDIAVGTVNQPGTGEVAYITSAGSLAMNSAYLNTKTDSQILNAALHELGHAMGLAHDSSSSSVMYKSNSYVTSLSENDKASLLASYERLG